VSLSRAILVVDGVSGVGALPFHMDAWHVDAVAIGSQKALMVPPGLALVSLSEKARTRMAGAKIPRFYLSLQKALKSLEADRLPDTPFTPPVSLLLQLRESIRAIEREGIPRVWARHARLGEATRAAVRALNLSLLVGEGASNVLTAVDCEKGPDAKAVVKRLRDDWGISVVGGQGKLKGRIFRIGHVGYVDEVDVLGTLAALEMVLSGLGWSFTPGAGVAAAEAVFLAARSRNA
jgi:aspartate aminotransferase-like enzyme